MVVLFLLYRFTPVLIIFWGKMKTIKYIIVTLILIIVLTAGLTSCGTAVNVKDDTNEVAGYTLKNKAELMQQKILNKKNKSILATP